MTKEELRQEAQESYTKLLRQINCGQDYNCETYNDGYIAGAEPREKRIEELEEENELIKNSDTLCKLIGEQKRKIAKLEKENAETKEIIGNFLKEFERLNVLCNYQLRTQAEQFLKENSTYERIQKAKYNYID